ncbi:probable sodium/potassium-transporting ATPase subunit beta-3 [Centruroides vittatus]|uniref:probable sodium/potassium-transporting ATPase subunit beta-3 n=1 Tax=Centruroides vittatus TaxID=120091 RepID=UPI00350FA7C6
MTGEELQLKTVSSETSPNLGSPDDIMWTLISTSELKTNQMSTWIPAKRIMTFMGMVSALCTIIVIAIVIVAALFLQQSSKPTSGIVYIIPIPEKLHNKPQTVIIRRKNVQSLKKQIAEMAIALKTYYDKQNTSEVRSCNFAMAPTHDGLCRFPLELINKNCTINNLFGYDTGNPCVALIFHVQPKWQPISYDLEVPDTSLDGDYDPMLVYLTCNTDFNYGMKMDYSPFHGFPRHFFPPSARDSYLPPLVMVQFIGVPINVEMDIKCRLWAKNIDRVSHQYPVFVETAFNLLIK